MRAIQKRLVCAAEWGSALALAMSCGGKAERDASPAPEEHDSGVVKSDASAAIAYPTPTCWGSSSNPCCQDVLCYDPGDAPCLRASEIDASSLPGFPNGVHRCHCQDAILGPFAPREEGQGSCCYLAASVACHVPPGPGRIVDGRPLLVLGRARVAALRARADWSRPSRRIAGIVRTS